MNMKKFAAAMTAAAMLTAFAPMSNVLPLNIIANAESSSDYTVGDVFYATFDADGNIDAVDETLPNGDGLECTVKADGTVSVTYFVTDYNYYRFCDKTLTIPSRIGSYTVSEVTKSENRHFSWSGCKKIVIPETVKIIGYSAFAFSYFLEEVEFAGNSQLELIDQWAFQDCRSLKSITIPASVETIAYGAFMNYGDNNKINTGDHPALAEKYGNTILDFNDVYSLTTVNFAEGSRLKTMGAYAFQSQKALEHIAFPEGVTTLERGIFCLCDSLKSFTIPASVETIEARIDESTVSPLFMGCTSLESITFAENSKLKTLNDNLFGDILALKSITIPASVETIGQSVFALGRTVQGDEYFRMTSSLTEINVSPDNKNYKSIDGILYTIDGKTLVACPPGKSEVKFADGVTEMQDDAFVGCNQITTVTIPDSVTKLPDNVFALCIKLKEITLPDTLTEIGDGAFQLTETLTDITIPESVTAIHEDAFKDSALKNISGKAGSYAETFARENGYTFIEIPTETPDDPSTSTPDTSSDESSDTPMEPLPDTSSAETSDTSSVESSDTSSVDSSDTSSVESSDTTSESDNNTFKDESADKAADIEVIAKPNVIPKDARFSVRIDDANTTAERVAYNCSFTYNGANYEPTDTVTVRIPVPYTLRDKAENLKVYHLQDGEYVNMSAKFENGYLVFDTDHFSIYVVTADDLTKTAPTETASSASTPASSSSASTTAPSNNPNTGIAVAAVPVFFAVSAAVIIISKKKK